MANQPGNGRNKMVPDEHDTWRPQDENAVRTRRMSDEHRDRDYGDDERFNVRERERMGSQWDDRSGRWDDREDRYRSTEHYGQGQSGYGAGRNEDDRSYGSRNLRQMSQDDRWRDRGSDDRFGGRGGEGWSPQDRGYGSQMSGYGQGREGSGNQGSYGSSGNMGAVGYGGQRQQRMQGPGYESNEMYGGYLGQGGQQMGYTGSRMGQDPYGMQNRHGAQGYQGADQQNIGGHRGKGPSGFTRSDDRIREIVCETLTDDDQIDATNIEVNVKNGEVTLNGTVEDRRQKRMAEDVIENLSCVKDVVNQLRVSDRKTSFAKENATSEGSSTSSGNAQSDKRHRA